ncbi:MAG: hypothetical protein JWN96_3879, partial [Mycobacterium sp.]|nr:hypothetical protein [Mycobacterium sp.]
YGGRDMQPSCAGGRSGPPERVGDVIVARVNRVDDTALLRHLIDPRTQVLLRRHCPRLQPATKPAEFQQREDSSECDRLRHQDSRAMIHLGRENQVGSRNLFDGQRFGDMPLRVAAELTKHLR